MKKLVLIIACLIGYNFASCNYSDFAYSEPCTVTSDSYPEISIGETACFTSSDKLEIKAVSNTTVNGIPVSIWRYHNPCKTVTNIIHKNNGKYMTVFSSATSYTPDYSRGSWYVIQKSYKVYHKGDYIELYRNNGTLRYKGRVDVSDDAVWTSGECYNKNGSAPTRHTNNADICR